MAHFDFEAIEEKWQRYWEDNKTFSVTEDSQQPADKRFYVLDMFPYPSGAGLHVGHPEGYTASDIIGRYKKMNGYNVLHPMGWDAFGLPAENYAIKTGTHPRVTTQQNIERFRQQIKSIGFGYDWDREFATTDPAYYRWTQWIFLQLYKKGLAYRAEVPINWCDSCKTGLANEEVKEGACDRCGHLVVKKVIPQWMLKITSYAERLLADLDKLDWPEAIKLMQRNWIGKSIGAEVDFVESSTSEVITVFTTRPDTLFGATFMVLAPEHPLLDKIVSSRQKQAVHNYIDAAATKSDLERTDLGKEKTGVFTGAYAVNPVNADKVPIWISDYVMITYGSGAIMAVPAHDQRDFEFAAEFDIPIIQVVAESPGQTQQLGEAFTDQGYAINSGPYDGLPTAEFKEKIIADLERQGKGKRAVNYKLRDWVFSRQRYWGEPIPLIHCEKCGIVPVGEKDLPLRLPDVERYEPTGTGQSPLANIAEWVKTSCPHCGAPAQRETNTMPQWAGSSWYFLRYVDPHNDEHFAGREKLDYWGPVDLYIGGAEHAVLHLLYARFWHKFLFDIGAVPFDEPFQRLINQGMILAEDGRKMSKSLGNVINPDDVISEYGADTLRMYEMFMGPLEVTKPWNTQAIGGVRKFLDRVWRLVDQSDIVDEQPPDYVKKSLHKALHKVTADLDNYRFNTAISAMMILVNDLYKEEKQFRSVLNSLVLMLSPFAPHMCEEMWSRLGNNPSVAEQSWPRFDELYLVDEMKTIVIQVMGKVRSRLEVPADISREELQTRAQDDEKVKHYLTGKHIQRIVVVPGKLVNIVAK
ncbi:MAG: leucine--tRNA ligase [Chitinivibrionales bacterium]|nr:leucine--tRNA ligase [Chitinivibrionales bacterium]